jgi:hypothetical protein
VPKVELKKTFRVPLDRALEYFGDHDLYNSCHLRDDATCTTLSREGSEVLVEVTQDVDGRPITFTNRTVYRLPHSIELETLSGPAKGSRQKVTFASVPEGTTVTYASDFKLAFGGAAGKALRMVSGKMMKKMMTESMEEAAEIDRRHLEGEPPPPDSAAAP